MPQYKGAKCTRCLGLYSQLYFILVVSSIKCKPLLINFRMEKDEPTKLLLADTCSTDTAEAAGDWLPTAAEVSHLLDTPDSDEDPGEKQTDEEAMDTGDGPVAGPSIELMGDSKATGVTTNANPPSLRFHSTPLVREHEIEATSCEPPAGRFRRPSSGLYSAIRDIRAK